MKKEEYETIILFMGVMILFLFFTIIAHTLMWKDYLTSTSEDFKEAIINVADIDVEAVYGNYSFWKSTSNNTDFIYSLEQYGCVVIKNGTYQIK